MKTNFKSSIRAVCHSFGGVVCAGAVLLIASNATAQNLFVAGWGSYVITEITPGSVQSTFASGLFEPEGLAFDSAGDLFVSVGASSGSILEFTPGGVQSTFASGLVNPSGLAFDSAGNLFETDWGSGNIYEFTPGGMRSTFASGLSGPGGLAFNSAGDLFVTEDAGGNIYEFTPGGVRSTFASGLARPNGLAFDGAGNLFEADMGSGNIYEFTPGGVRSTFASGFSELQQLAFDSAGNLYAADLGSGNIYELTPGGVQSTFASGLGPTGLAFQGEPLPVPAPSAQAAQLLTINAAFESQGGTNDNGKVTTIKAPIRHTLDTKRILEFLARDEYAEGKLASSNFPACAKLVVINGDFRVLDKTNNFLVDVSDILSAQTGTNHIFSGRINDGTGLYDNFGTGLCIVRFNYDDSRISGGVGLQFYLAGLMTSTVIDTINNKSGGYTEVHCDTLDISAGEGIFQGTPFVITGSLTMTGKQTLTLPRP